MIHYLGVLGVAEQLGVADSTAKKYRSIGFLPPPDATIGDRAGWLPETIDAWNGGRPGHGGRPPANTGRSTGTHPAL